MLQGTAEELLANRDMQRAYLGRDASAENGEAASMTPSTSPAVYWQPDLECMDREELEQLQLEQLEATLVARRPRNVPFYRERFEAIGFDPDELRSADDLRRLPFTEKRHLVQAYPYGLFAVPLREVVRRPRDSAAPATPPS